ncbi:MAG: hypothetical protein WBM15_07080, partial [Chromatiaceae bacterium]
MGALTEARNSISCPSSGFDATVTGNFAIGSPVCHLYSQFHFGGFRRRHEGGSRMRADKEDFRIAYS